jgi:hypothetical protein
LKTLTIIKTLAVSFLVAACAQTDFSGDSGQGIRSGKKIPPGTPGTPGKPGKPGTPTTPNNPVITTEDGGKIEVIETTLTIVSNSDHARFKNCVNAKLTNLPTEPAKELGCNRDAPYGSPRSRGSVKMKVQTNVCNVMSISFTSQSAAGGPIKTLSTSSASNRFRISRKGPNSFNIMANDNDDGDWNDLNLDVTGDGSFKFTIEGQGGCQ